MSRSPSFRALGGLQVGDVVPADAYVLDYRDGTRPDWRVAARHDYPRSRGVRLELVDVANRAQLDFVPLPARDGDVAVTVLAWPDKTLRSRPYLLGQLPGNTLADLDQQARHVAKERAA